MTSEKTITLEVERGGETVSQEVRMRYCAASETGFETLSGKSSAVFSPVRKVGEDGEERVEFPEISLEDQLRLAIASIVAAYAMRGEDAPVTAEEILYAVKPDGIGLLVRTVWELRAAWYQVPGVVEQNELIEDTDKASDQSPKNA